MPEFSWSSALAPLDTERIIASLHGWGVEYVLVGGVAALVHGSTHLTADADMVPRPSSENLSMLMRALRELDAEIYVPAERLRMEAGEPWEIAELRRGPDGLLSAEAWHFTTPAGPIDVVMDAAAVGGYDAHLANVERHTLFQVEVLVAGIDDLIATKEHLGRDKDLAVLAELREIRDGGSPG